MFGFNGVWLVSIVREMVVLLPLVLLMPIVVLYPDETRLAVVFFIKKWFVHP